MTGVDIPIPAFQTILRQPQIRNIAMIGEDTLFTGIHYLCLNKEQLIQDKSLLETLDNFQILLKVINEKGASKQKEAVIQLLSLLFPDVQIIFSGRSFMVNNPAVNQSFFIDSSNFAQIQEVLKKVLCVHNIFQGDNVIYNPVNAAAQKIADKIMRGRQKIAQMNNNKKESAIARYISILTIEKILTIEECCKLTLYQLFDIVERYKLWQAWDINLRIRLAGGDPKSEPEDWTKSIH